ncbi:MAG: alpha/beta hydrolase [Pikeienuella sp.]|uniref:alpha/beta hydrolase n=1 Tax=Pikeienuella sp. TaxID=2831957 RepID=UPI00391DB283
MSWGGDFPVEAWAGAPGFYERGPTPCFTSRFDPRISFCLHVPAAPERIAAFVHGTGRGAETVRDAVAAFAEATATLVLAPLFPAGIEEPGALSGYKRLRSRALAYDLALIDMIDEVSERFGVQERRVLMHGFSGGGHFAHRFLFAHPERLLACSVGAPGVVTRLDEGAAWPIGLKGFEAIFGRSPDLAAIARVPVQLVIGAEDRETWEIALRPGDGWWAPGAEWQARSDRIVRIAGLRADLDALGCRIRYDEVSGVAHDGSALVPSVLRFFEDILAEE